MTNVPITEKQRDFIEAYALEHLEKGIGSCYAVLQALFNFRKIAGVQIAVGSTLKLYAKHSKARIVYGFEDIPESEWNSYLSSERNNIRTQRIKAWCKDLNELPLGEANA